MKNDIEEILRFTNRPLYLIPQLSPSLSLSLFLTVQKCQCNMILHYTMLNGVSLDVEKYHYTS